jgi:hypothetical protein
MNVDFPTPVSPNINTLIAVFDDDVLCNGGEDVDGACSCETGGKARASYIEINICIFFYSE